MSSTTIDFIRDLTKCKSDIENLKLAVNDIDKRMSLVEQLFELHMKNQERKISSALAKHMNISNIISNLISALIGACVALYIAGKI